MPNQVRIGAGVTGAKQAASELDQLRDKFTKLRSEGAKGFAIGAGAAVTAKALSLVGTAASDVTQFVGESIQAASDLNETLNKSQVVFGGASKQMEAFGKTAALSLGLSENAAVGAASSIGNLLLSTGTAKDKIEPMSEAIVKLASDLASFNNIDPTEALAKLQSGLVGQERPLRELGVAISAASVDTEALALGFHKVNGEFTEGEKVQARYSLIFKQTKTAQGDFARTADQLANSQRIQTAELEDAKAALGKDLLPVMLEVTKAEIAMTKEIAPAVAGFEQLAKAADDAAKPVGGLGGVLGDVVGAFNPLLRVTDNYKANAEAQAAAQTAANIAMRDASRAATKAADDVYHAGDAAQYIARSALKAADDIYTVGDASIDTSKDVHQLSSRFDSARRAAGELEGALADLDKQLYGSKILAGDLAQAQQDLADTLKESPKSGLADAVEKLHLAELRLHELRTSKGKVSASSLAAAEDRVTKAQEAVTSATKNGSREFQIWQGKVAAAKQAVFDLQYQEKQTEGPKATYEWLVTQEKQLKATDKKALQYLRTLEALALLAANFPAVNIKGSLDPISSGGGGTGGTHKFAEGGIVKARPGGTLAIIGEAGQDEAVIPIGKGATAGKLVASTGGGGGTVVNINVNGVSVLTPGSAEALARHLEPIITRAQQKRGQFGAGAR